MSKVSEFDWRGLMDGAPSVVHCDLNDCVAGLVERFGSTGLFYLATPYSKVSLDMNGVWCPVRSEACSFEASRWVAMFAANRLTVISPIVLSASAAAADVSGGLDPLDATMWNDWCGPILKSCDAVIVPPIEGWRESAGIWHEVMSALSRDVPVFLLEAGGAGA